MGFGVRKIGKSLDSRTAGDLLGERRSRSLEGALVNLRTMPRVISSMRLHVSDALILTK
jgi:hypothetical protein